MKKMKKISAALLAVLLLVSMLSCMVFPATAATTLGGPVPVEKVTVTGGQVITGVALPSNVLVVSSDWAGKSNNSIVYVKLDGKNYKAYFGINAFADICDAVRVAESNDTIYVTAGVYNGNIDLTRINRLKVYGPWAGVSPNNPDFTCAEDLRDANPNRPDANNMDAEAASATEAVYYGTVNMISVASNPDSFTTFDGLYFAGTSTFTLGNGGVYRIGTIIRNNVVNVTTTQFINMNRGMNPGFLAEYNRVLKGKQFHGTGGFMGSIHRYNYFNLSDFMFYPGSMQNGNVGQIANIECNYFEECNGIFYYGPNNYQVVSYSVIIKDNYINQVGVGSYIVNNEFDAFHSQPGITFQITGNEFHGIPRGTTLFKFPYRASEHNLNRYRYIININDNVIDLPANQALVNAEMAGKIDCSYNKFLQGVALKQIVHNTKDCDVILYPYYDAAGNLIGDAKIVSVVNGSVNQEDKTAQVNLGDFAEDVLDLEEVLVATGDYKVFEDATLLTEVDGKIVYFDGYVTTRYIAVLAPDGAIGNVYTLTVTKNIGQDAKLLAVQENNSQVTTVQDGSKFTVSMPADLPFLDYTLKVSAGATVELYKDANYSEKAEITSNYIPYGENGAYYTLYVKVISEDGVSAMGYYTVVFERDRSAIYDPSIIAITTPEGDYTIRPDRTAENTLWMAYYAGNVLMDNTVFEFETTPGATYTVYDKDMKEVSSSADPKALVLKDGANNFTIKVKDAKHETEMKFVVENGTRSNDTGIVGVIGQAPVILNNTITLIIGGNSFNGTFETRSPYATVQIFADPGKQVEMAYSSTPMTEFETNRIIDERNFVLPTAHAKNVYYIVVTAEDGTKGEYTLYLTKNVNPVTYIDVSNDAWYAPYVEQATNAGIIAGESVGEEKQFRPEDYTSREEMATIIARLMGINGAAFADTQLKYADNAKISDWAMDNVKACKFYGVMNGSNEGGVVYFYPQKNITREEVMAIVARMFNLNGDVDLSQFKDANKISSWAVEEVKATVAASLVAGDDNGYLNPRANITRAEIATIVTRILDNQY